MYARFLKIVQLNSENLRTGHEHRVQEERTENSLTDTWGEDILLTVSCTESLVKENCGSVLWAWDDAVRRTL